MSKSPSEYRHRLEAEHLVDSVAFLRREVVQVGEGVFVFYSAS